MTAGLTVDINANNRLTHDNSIYAFADGGFYDHNGQISYRDIRHLAEERPDLVYSSDTPYKPSKTAAKNTHNLVAVTKAVQEAKGKQNTAVLDSYLPFYNLERIRSNAGTQNGHLAVFMWTPVLGGAKRGKQYSMGQYRGSNNAKWMSFKGSDGKTAECAAPNPGAVYCTFGMGDFLLLKSTGLNYLCFGADGAAKNNHHKDFILKKIAGKTVRLIADNDPSGQQTAGELRALGLTVHVFDWRQLGGHATPKMDLRDIGWIVRHRGGTMQDLVHFLVEEARFEK